MAKRVIPLHQRRVDPFDAPIGELSCTHTKEIMPLAFRYTEKYLLEIKYGIEFWATEPEFNVALRQAEKVLTHKMFASAYKAIDEARLEVMGGNREGAMQALGKIERALSVLE